MHLTQNQILRILFSCCIASLLIAFSLQRVLETELCTLCTYQRYIFGAAALVALLGSRFLDVPGLSVFTVLTVLFLINSSLASYQVALEYGWIEESIFCKSSANLINAQSLEELRKTLINEGFKNCAKPEILIFGMSIAFYNAIFSFALAVASLFGLACSYEKS